ncbi:MAG TPA: MmcB family DNA repair protein [Rhizomicrobium sp.]|nr:MmcB family DNA repair protein [Rhizomicrobium sp.]
MAGTLTAEEMITSCERLFRSHGLTPKREFVLPNGKRIDLVAFGKTGNIAGVEVKRDVRDFNRDVKWPTYLPFCKVFYFAVPQGFPRDIIPEKLGLILCTRDRAEIVRGLSGCNRIPATVLLRV